MDPQETFAACLREMEDRESRKNCLLFFGIAEPGGVLDGGVVVVCLIPLLWGKSFTHAAQILT